jgi:hypothetical protein
MDFMFKGDETEEEEKKSFMDLFETGDLADIEVLLIMTLVQK